MLANAAGICGRTGMVPGRRHPRGHKGVPTQPLWLAAPRTHGHDNAKFVVRTAGPRMRGRDHAKFVVGTAGPRTRGRDNAKFVVGTAGRVGMEAMAADDRDRERDRVDAIN